MIADGTIIHIRNPLVGFNNSSFGSRATIIGIVTESWYNLSTGIRMYVAYVESGSKGTVRYTFSEKDVVLS